jgi:hypothetical protein
MSCPLHHNVIRYARSPEHRDSAMPESMESRAFRLWDAELLYQRIEPTIAEIGVIQVRARP